MNRHLLLPVLIAAFTSCATGLTPQPLTQSQAADEELDAAAAGGRKPNVKPKSEMHREDALKEIDASNYDNVFPIVDGDADVGDDRISDVRLTGVISSITKLKLAKLMLLNKTGRTWKPDFKLRILNKYGVALGHGSVRWAIHALPKDERYEEEARLETFSHAEIFKYSSVQPVPDFDRPAFIAIEHAPK